MTNGINQNVFINCHQNINAHKHLHYHSKNVLCQQERKYFVFFIQHVEYKSLLTVNKAASSTVLIEMWLQTMVVSLFAAEGQDK